MTSSIASSEELTAVIRFNRLEELSKIPYIIRGPEPLEHFENTQCL